MTAPAPDRVGTASTGAVRAASAVAVTAPCPLCGSTSLTDRPGPVRFCRGCRIGHTTTPVERHSFEGDYFTGGGYDDDYFVPSARTFEASRRVAWLRRVTGTGSTDAAGLVEVGSAGGFFVRAARQAGWDALGVEPSELAGGYARDVLGVPVVTGFFERLTPADLPAGHRRPRLVCAFHVIEHVANPAGFLRSAAALLPTGGLLALEVPNYASGAAERLGPAWAGLQPDEHRWHFTPAGLTGLLDRSGFTTERLDTPTFRFYMPRRYRWSHLRRLLPADLRHTRSARLVPAGRGDLLRVLARHRGRS